MFFSKILILITRDEKYIDHDTGEIAPLLRDRIQGLRGVELHEMKDGDVFCGILNESLHMLQKDGIDFACIISPSAHAYLVEATMQRVVRAIGKGAKVVGVAINQIASSVLSGRIANTFAVWDIRALLSVGGFDVRASQFLKKEDSHRSLPAGCEEMIPLKLLVDKFGPCIAPLPVHQAIWVTPHMAKDTEGYDRHVQKIRSKKERQEELLAAVGVGLDYLEKGILPHYRIG